MRKKLVSVLMGAVLAAGTLAGCGGGSGDTASEKENSTNKESDKKSEDKKEEKNADASTTLKWAMWDRDLVTYWDGIADAYMEKNPDVRIEIMDLGSADYMTVLSTELSGEGSDFDVVTVKDMQCYTTLVSKGVLEDLTERVSADNIDLSVYNGVTDQMKADGKILEMPLEMTSGCCTITKIYLMLLMWIIRQTI